MNILITGGAGYIGSNVAFLLIDKGHKVTIIDNLVTGTEKVIPKEANFLNADISDIKKVTKLLQSNSFNLVMHFAGLVRVEESIKYPEKYNLYNIEKAKIFFKTCFDNGISKVIFSSTASVYGKNNKKDKVKETDKIEILNPYAFTKHEVEKYLLDVSSKNEISCIILRYFNVAGADEKQRSGLLAKNSNNLIKVVCEVATKRRDKIIVNGSDYETPDGTPVRDFIHISDLAEIHATVGEHINIKKDSGIYNCGYGEGYSVQEVISKMKEISEDKIEFELGPRRNGDIPYSVADNNKFKKKFNWNPKHNDLKYILKSALNWEKNLNKK